MLSRFHLLPERNGRTDSTKPTLHVTCFVYSGNMKKTCSCALAFVPTIPNYGNLEPLMGVNMK